MSVKVGMVSLGCPKNQVDAELMLGHLADAGYDLVEDAAMADVAIVNTCGFIESAKSEAIEEILELAALKKEGRIKAIVVTGCMAERYRDAVLEEMPEIDGNNFSIAVSGTLQPMIQAYDFELALYDEENGRIIYYGQDEYVYLDGEGNLVSEFDGEWVFLDGQPLALEITSKTISSVEYRSHVRYNGSDAYLLFAYDRDTEEFEIKGIRLFPDDGDQINFTVNSKSNVVLQPKDTIVPVYPTTDFNGMTSEIEGEKITYQATSSIVMKGLPSGYYLAMANIYDQRGDSYSSKVIGYVISGGKIKECELNPDFVGTDY